jgi:uncharacterized MAPEG superfamily protein
MVGQAPEYVSLAYGAVKILLVVQVNYEEMKQNVEGYMDKIKTKFQMIDHLTTYLPTERLVAAIAKMYDFFNRFLAKALKFYTRGKISKEALYLQILLLIRKLRARVQVACQAMETA